MVKKRLASIFTVTLACILMITACGGGSSSSISPVSSTIVESQSVAASATLPESDTLKLLPATPVKSSEKSTASTSLQASLSSSVEYSATPAVTKSETKVHFIDVGQADSILIQSANENMLIDAGNNGDGSLVVNYLKQTGVSSLKYVIATHPHEDHIGGMDNVIKAFNIGTFIMPEKETTTKTFEDMLDALVSKNLSATAPEVGKTYQLGDASFTILSPNKDYGSDLNNWSVGIKLINGNTSFVMCGDAEAEAEADILKTGIALSADVLKLGHHGSSTSTSNAFLKAVSPKYTVISCGVGNTYGHPHAETLSKLAAANVKLFRTDECGTIVATSDGINITWNVAPIKDVTANPGSIVGAESKEPSSKAAVASASSAVISSSAAPIASKTMYILNTNTKKFHYPSCGSAAKIKDSNRQETTKSREQLIAEGYSPCGNCDP